MKQEDKKKLFTVAVAAAAVVSVAAFCLLFSGGAPQEGEKAPIKVSRAKSSKTLAGPKVTARRQKAAERIRQTVGMSKPSMALAEDEEALLSDEMKKILADLQTALDDNDSKTVSALAEQILVTQRRHGENAVPPFVREKAVEAIGFFLPGSLADLVGFMADSDPDVLQDVMDKFAEAIDDPDLGDRELASILTSVSGSLTNDDAVEALFTAIESDMRNSVAVETYLTLWQSGTEAIKEKIVDSISDFTGDDDITTPEDLKKWLEENPDDEDDDDFYAGDKDSGDDEEEDEEPEAGEQ